MNLLHKIVPRKNIRPVDPEFAYDLWSADYDHQPGNLMLDLDARVFSKLIHGIIIEDKDVIDVGCGTGRHWETMLAYKPSNLTGFDVSAGMLKKLTAKIPGADVRHIKDGHKLEIEDNSADILISTLTIAHITNLPDTLKEWSRVLKSYSDIIITDFHPDSLSVGAQRTFRYNNRTIVVANKIHGIPDIKTILYEEGFTVQQEETIKIDESIKHYYESKAAIHLYDRFYGVPVIYGLHFVRR